MKLHNFLKPELVKIDCESTEPEALLKEIVAELRLKNRSINPDQILGKLLEREKLGSTSIGNHSAVPHTKLPDLKEPIVFVGISRQGIRYHKDDKELVHFILLILSPTQSPIIHLQILAAAASLIKKSKSLIKEILLVESADELIDLIRKYETADDQR